MAGVYLDASAIAKLFLPEPERAPLEAWLHDRPTRVASVIAIVEVHRAAARHGQVAPGTITEAMASLVLLDLDRRIIGAAAALTPPGLRTLDAIHLASALEVGTELEALVTYDRRLAAAARDAGLEVASPGDDI